MLTRPEVLVHVPLVGCRDQREGLLLGVPDLSEVGTDEEVVTVSQAGHLHLDYPPRSSMTERHVYDRHLLYEKIEAA